jgi:beta-galactosidase
MANEEGGIQRDLIGKKVMKKMVAYSHKLDPTRLTTAGVNAWGSKADYGFAQEIDVMGFNYSLDFIDQYHKDHPTQPIIGTETSNSSVTRGVSSFDKSGVVALADGIGGYYVGKKKEHKKYAGHIPSNKIGSYKTIMKYLKFYAERDYLSGFYLWTGFDYKGETWPNTFPNNSSQFAAIDIAGFPKASYYLYKSWWTNEPVLHILGHWNWKGMEGKEIEMPIFTNTDEVELFLNGKLIGKEKVKKHEAALFKLNYESGELKAKGYKNGKLIKETSLKTVSNPFALKAKAHKNSLKASFDDMVLVEVQVVDKKGNNHPLANNMVEFTCSEGLEILGVGNGDPSCLELDKANSRSAFNGKCMVMVRARKGYKEGKLEIKSEGIVSEFISLKIIY